MVEDGNVLHHVKWEGELSGRGKCLGENVSEGEMSGSPDNSVIGLLLLMLFPR